MADHFNLHLTSAGRGELADSANAGINNVQLRRIGLGTGSGPGDAADADARIALRAQEDIQDVAGSAQPDSGRIGVTAIFPALMAGDPDVEIREMGIYARVGDGGAEFLLSYGAVPAADPPLTTLTASGRTVMTGVMDISSAEADVAITVSPSITFEGLDGATDAETAAGVRRDRAVTPGSLHSVLSLITVLHLTVSNPNYVWDLPFSRALVILKGADSGGGGGGGGGGAGAPIASGSADAFDGGSAGNGSAEEGDTGGRHYDSEADDTFRGGGGGGQGADSLAGGDTTLEVDGATYTAPGAPPANGGFGGGGGRAFAAAVWGGKGGGMGNPSYAKVTSSGLSGTTPAAAPGGGGGAAGGSRGQVSGADDVRNGAAGGSAWPGNRGGIVAQIVTGLSRGDSMAITIGAASPGAAGGQPGGGGYTAATAGVNGGAAQEAGWARIIPLPNDS